MRIDILSIFPEMFDAVLDESILRIAQEKGAVRFCRHDIRDWTEDRHGKVDDRPFGGGPGMVMRAQPVVDAVEAVQAMARPAGRLLFMTPRGRRLRQDRVRELAGEERLVLVCGRYEGFDERIFAALQPEEVSIGDYVLTGGELPAMVVCDAVVRLLPGVLGDPASPQEESFEHGLLDHPHYTQPAAWRGRAVPEILRSGHHERVRRWRAEQARASTRARRPDLLNAESETTERDEQPQGDWPPEAPAPQEPGDDPWTP